VSYASLGPSSFLAGAPMDRVSTNILAGFSREYEIEALDEFKRFEWLTTFLALRRHYSRAVDLAPLVIGGGDDSSIDGIAILINNTLVTDVDEAKEIIEKSDTLEVTFIFVQADRGEKFDGSKIGDFGFGVRDFFSEKPTLPRNEDLKRHVSISDLIIEHSAKLKRPSCYLYYWTTGKWQDDKNLIARRDGVTATLLRLTYSSASNSRAKEPTRSIPNIPAQKSRYLGHSSSRAASIFQPQTAWIRPFSATHRIRSFAN
jgi:hypothetical protein